MSHPTSRPPAPPTSTAKTPDPEPTNVFVVKYSITPAGQKPDPQVVILIGQAAVDAMERELRSLARYRLPTTFAVKPVEGPIEFAPRCPTHGPLGDRIYCGLCGYLDRAPFRVPDGDRK